MRRFTAVFAIVGLLLAGLIGGPATASTFTVKGQFANCKALNKKFANGLAKSRSAANEAVSYGYKRPRVSPALYKLNVLFDRTGDGAVCLVAAPLDEPSSSDQQQAPPESTAPPAVASLAVTANTPVRGDTQVIFNIGWQIPSAAPFTSFEVVLQDGSRKTVNRSDGVPVAPDVLGFAARGFGPFGATVTVSVTPYNLVVPGPASAASLQLPPAAKSTYTVEITAGSGPCVNKAAYISCYVSITNSTGGTDIHSSMGSWSYEASRGHVATAYVKAEYGNPSTCSIRIDGVVVSTQTSNGSTAWCAATVR